MTLLRLAAAVTLFLALAVLFTLASCLPGDDPS